MSNHSQLKAAAEAIREGSGLEGAEAQDAMVLFEGLATPDAVLALIADLDEARNGMKFQPALRLKLEIDQLKAEVEALRKKVADLSPFKGAPLTGPDTRCLACGGYHYGLGNLPCPVMRVTAQSSIAHANQRVAPPEPMIAGRHPLDVAPSKEAGQ